MKYSLRKWRMTDAEDIARAGAVPVYVRLGFQATDTEQLTDGLRYTPMIFKGE